MLTIAEKEHLKYILITDTINKDITAGRTSLYRGIYMVDDPSGTSGLLIHWTGLAWNSRIHIYPFLLCKLGRI